MNATAITTTHNIEGKTISGYLGIIVGESIIATNILRDITAGLRDIVGGRSGAYEEKMQEALASDSDRRYPTRNNI